MWRLVNIWIFSTDYYGACRCSASYRICFGLYLKHFLFSALWYILHHLLFIWSFMSVFEFYLKTCWSHSEVTAVFETHRKRENKRRLNHELSSVFTSSAVLRILAISAEAFVSDLAKLARLTPDESAPHRNRLVVSWAQGRLTVTTFADSRQADISLFRCVFREHTAGRCNLAGTFHSLNAQCYIGVHKPYSGSVVKPLLLIKDMTEWRLRVNFSLPLSHTMLNISENLVLQLWGFLSHKSKYLVQRIVSH